MASLHIRGVDFEQPNAEQPVYFVEGAADVIPGWLARWLFGARQRKVEFRGVLDYGPNPARVSLFRPGRDAPLALSAKHMVALVVLLKDYLRAWHTRRVLRESEREQIAARESASQPAVQVVRLVHENQGVFRVLPPIPTASPPTDSTNALPPGPSADEPKTQTNEAP